MTATTRTFLTLGPEGLRVESEPPAFEMRDGAAVPCAFYGHERRRPAAPSPILWPTPRMSKRETRRAARAGGKRLRFWAPGTRPLRPIAPFRYVPPEFVRDIGHRLSDGAREVVLYLPEGERVGPEHSRAIARALRDR